MSIGKFEQKMLMVSLFARRILRDNQIIGLPLVRNLKMENLINP